MTEYIDLLKKIEKSVELIKHVNTKNNTLHEPLRPILLGDQVIRIGEIGNYDIIKVVTPSNLELLYLGYWNDGVGK